MATNDIKQRVENVFQACFGSEILEKFRDHPKPFTTHAEAAGNPGASDLLDSLDQVEFVMALEEEFSVNLADGEFEKLTTLADAAAYLETKVTAEQK